MITDTLTINDDTVESIDLFNNPHHVLHSIDSLLAGILEDPAQRVDRWYSRGMTNHMFETVPFKGLDIVSLNIQRGRDHGLPRNVNDIDLYSGALHELPVAQGVVGETYACLIGRQFENLKFGDRFWYQNTDAPNAFTNAQIAQIEGQSLATVLCQTTGLESVQANAFMNVARK
ncbi:chorion peroxidase [Plakobranchus ocellatus]|uniref:Chorion peroxidase n=1 Tax=Plakobranchus ocellatus TaxID=259542 RepID=A0AAV3YZL0_9GAST|nr:chorion peroxidase [Plakobranchus ocellatus]